MGLWKKMLDFDIEAARNQRFANKRIYVWLVTLWLAMGIHIFTADASPIRWVAVAVASAGTLFFVAWSVKPSKDERMTRQAFLAASITVALLNGMALVWLVAPGTRDFTLRILPSAGLSLAMGIGALTAWLIER